MGEGAPSPRVDERGAEGARGVRTLGTTAGPGPPPLLYLRRPPPASAPPRRLPGQVPGRRAPGGAPLRSARPCAALPALCRRCPVTTASPVTGCSQVVLFASSLQGREKGQRRRVSGRGRGRGCRAQPGRPPRPAAPRFPGPRAVPGSLLDEEDAAAPGDPVARELGLFILQFDKLNIVRQMSSLSLCRKWEEHQREEVDSFPPGPLERWLYILQDDLIGKKILLMENGREREKKETKYHISLLEPSHQSADGITLNNLSSFGKF
ncbi:uncharacterized protein [Manis javanica]|uniref:uncharacterized protein n=1 Tax=Manis javanica TaxID=9974 RepID=UPI003C6CF8FE